MPHALKDIPRFWASDLKIGTADLAATLLAQINGAASLATASVFSAQLTAAMAPPASGVGGSLQVGNGGFAGGSVPNFQGSVNGTLIAGNTAAGFTGDLANLEVGGVSKLRVDQNGNIYQNGVLLTSGAGGASLGSANAWTMANTFTLDDNNPAGISYPVTVAHTYSGTVGQVGIGVGMNFVTEGGNVDNVNQTIGRLQFATTNVNNQTSNLQVQIFNNAVEQTVAQFAPHQVSMLQPPQTTGDYGLLSLAEGGFGSGAPNFVGNTSGTIIAVNSPSTFAGDLMSLERAGLTRLNVNGDGRVGIGQPAATGPQAMLHVTRPSLSVPDAIRTTYLRVTGAADTFVQLGNAADDVRFDLNRTVHFDGGSVRGAQNALTIVAPTYTALNSSTITQAATVFINSAPIAGANMTLTNTYALYVNGLVRFDPTAGNPVFYLNQNDVALTGAILGRIPISVAGTTRFIPYYAS